MDKFIIKKPIPSELSQNEFIAIFGGVFEKSNWIAEDLFKLGIKSKCDNCNSLHKAMVEVFRASSDKKKLGVLLAHPDLAGKLAQRGKLTEESQNEQKSAGLDQLTSGEFSEFQYLNTTYMNKHGFPFIIAVKGLTKLKILSEFKKRVNNSNDAEFYEACLQVEKIAYIRIKDIID